MKPLHHSRDQKCLVKLHHGEIQLHTEDRKGGRSEDIAPAVGVGGCTAWGCSMEDTKDGLNSTRRMPPPHEGRQDDKTEVGAEADRCRGKTRNHLSRCNSQTAVPGERRSPGQMPR